MWRELDLYEQECFRKLDSIAILVGKVLWYGAIAFFAFIFFELFKAREHYQTWALLVPLPFAFGTLVTMRKLFWNSKVENKEIAKVMCIEKFECVDRHPNGNRSVSTVKYYAKYRDENGEIDVADVRTESLYKEISENEEIFIVRLKNKERKEQSYEAYPILLSKAIECVTTVDDIKKLIGRA